MRPVRHVAFVSPEALSTIVTSTDIVPDAAFRRRRPATVTLMAAELSPMPSPSSCVPENRFLPLRAISRSRGPGEKPGDAVVGVTDEEYGSPIPSLHFARHARTADLSLVPAPSAVRTMASPELVLPPYTAFAAKAPGAAPSVVA